MTASILRRLPSLFILVCSTAWLAACRPGQAADARSAANGAQGEPLDPVAVSDADFSRSTCQVLLNDELSSQRQNLLAGVVRRQLTRASARFAAGHRDAGLRALTGGLYLVRAGELRKEMYDTGAPALSAGADEVARVGNEGRALALYGMLQSFVKDGKERRDIDAHVAALGRWSGSTRSAGRMQAAGAEQRAAVGRSLFDASNTALERARDKTVAWIRRALESNISELPIRNSFEREEAIEAYRALRAGGATLIAIYLRHGDPQGALDAIDRADLSKMIPPGLRDRLERAADDDDPAAWLDLFQLFETANSASRPETALDEDLARAASWGTALALYRSEPGSMRGAGPLSVQLAQYGMAEVAPCVLASALRPGASAEDVGWALGLMLRAIVSEDEIAQLGAARRTFEASKPLLELAETPKLRAQVRPSAARLSYVMGALETRAGELDRARPLIEKAVRSEPSIEALGTLAAIERQRRDYKSALTRLDQIVALAKKGGDAASECEARTHIFEIHRDRNALPEAKTALDTALSRCLDARQLARGGASQARAERLLARVLEQYGDTAALRRATERAYDASLSDMRQLTATVLDAARRALLRGDISAARDAVQRAVEADLADEDIVYAALWLQLLERKLNIPSDGTVEEAFATIEDAASWSGKLRAWARGRMADAELIKSARSRLQHTEAVFYVAMAHHTGGKRDAALPKLREVAQSEAIELVEVAIARDLVFRESSARLDVKLPPNADLP
jgi:tetratricopeptide (TPR) repeat protein